MSVRISQEKRSSQTSPDRVFVIGIDGATFDLIKPWVRKGKLTNIARLMRTGAHGELTTTIQPLTGPAWTSFMTGKNPGKHGVFDFIMRVPGTYDVRLIDSASRDSRSIWNLLSQYGKDVAVINIPLNYPPEKVKGVLISWMDAPGVDREFTYPPDLYQDIKKHVGEYVITVDFSASLDKHIHEINRMTDNRAAVTQYIMENYPWDFFVTLFSATDFVQHTFWKYMDERHPQFDEKGAKKYGHVILETYQRIDRHLGRILEKLDGDVTVIVMSDHGAGPLHKVVNLNRWLEQQGWLTFTAAAQQNSSSALGLPGRRTLLHLAQRASMLMKRTSPKIKGRLKKRFPALGSKMESFFLSSTIDWAHTKAFALGAYGNIWINLKGREPQGVVEPGQEFEELCEEISQRLLALKDPDTGGLVVDKVYRRDDLYYGPFVPRASDLIVRWHNYAYYSRQRFGEREQSVFQTHLTRPLSSIQMNAYHRLNGILIVNGKNIVAGKEIQNARILDVAPTVFHLMGLPVPRDMDGSVLVDLFRPSFLDSRPILYEDSEPGKRDQPTKDIFSEEEEKIIKDRLRGLGYL